MIYLILSIVFMSALAVALRLGVAKGASPLGLNAVFRATAGVVMLVVMASTVDASRFAEVWVVAGRIGLTAGLFYWLAGFAVIKAVQLGHLGVSWTVLRCSMVLPTLASLLYWREVPLWPVSGTLILRLLGIVLTTSAVVALGFDRAGQVSRPGASGDRSRTGRAWLLWMAAAFLGQGAWEISIRATRSFPDDQTRMLFVTLVFAFASLFTLPLMGIFKARVGRTELRYGLLAGVLGLLASALRVWAIRDVDGIIVFPTTTITVILLVQLASRTIWRERVGRLGLGGFALAFAGILLLTLRL